MNIHTISLTSSHWSGFDVSSGWRCKSCISSYAGSIPSHASSTWYEIGCAIEPRMWVWKHASTFIVRQNWINYHWRHHSSPVIVKVSSRFSSTRGCVVSTSISEWTIACCCWPTGNGIFDDFLSEILLHFLTIISSSPWAFSNSNCSLCCFW